MKSATTWRRGATAAALALPLALASATAAVAADGYGPTPQASVGLAVKSPECDGNVPYLRYAVDVSKDPSAKSVDITWTSLDGTHSETQKNLPVSGKVLWLGAEESGGTPTSWPGWVFKNGTWEEGGPYTWVRPEVRVTFTVHDDEYTGTGAASTGGASFSDGVYRPAAKASAQDAVAILPADNMVSGTVTYPPATTACANPLTTPAKGAVPPDGPSGLAATGSDVAPFAGAAVVLLAIGGALVLVGRRHRNKSLPQG